MIKFFRKIRKKLVSENKFSKYLIYAIGEIILVVIGILIALQINNWNEKDKQDSRSFQYQKRIYQDLNRLTENSRGLTSRADETLALITKTTELLELGNIETRQDSNTVESALIRFSRTVYRFPELPTYEEMKSNGELNLLYKVELRNQIASFSTFLKQVETVADKLSNAIESDFRIYNKYIRTYIDPESSEVILKYDFDRMASDEEFINTFSRLSFHWTGYVYFMKRVTSDAENLVVAFEEQLKTKK